jgi:hypothetical protein
VVVLPTRVRYLLLENTLPLFLYPKNKKPGSRPGSRKTSNRERPYEVASVFLMTVALAIMLVTFDVLRFPYAPHQCDGEECTAI